MKKVKLLIVAFVAMLVPTVWANAAELDSWEALKTCLTTSGDATCTVGNITDSSSADETVIVEGKKVLDLGGKTLAIANNTRFIVESGDSLTISNGTIEKYTRSAIVTVRVGATLTVSGDARLESKIDDNVAVISIVGNENDDETKTIVNIEKGAYIKGTVGVNTPADDKDVAYGVEINVSGTIEANGDSNALTINGAVKHVGGNVPVINVLDGAVIKASENGAIYAAGYGIWNIKGGEVTGREAIGAKAGVLNITGGTIKATGAYVEDPTEDPAHSPNTGSAIAIMNGGTAYAGNVSLHIENANVTSEHGYAIYEGQGDESETVLTALTLTSGTFAGGDGVEGNTLSFESSETDGTGLFEEFISGGTYTGTLNEIFVSSELEMEEDENGNIVVKEPVVETEDNENEDNPSTGDNMLTYAVMGTVALVGALGTIVYFKKVNE